MSYVGTNGGNKTLAQALPNWKWAFVPQVGLHTTEFPVGHSLLALFQFLNTRTTHGSYHAAADADGASSQYCPWSWGAWHAPSINRWSAGVAGNCRTSDWDTMTTTQRRNLINGMALQAHRYSRWCVSQGLGPVPARRLTKAQAERREHGFVYHGALQSDRTDPTGPRDRFPWAEFIAEFQRLERGGVAPASGTVVPAHDPNGSIRWPARPLPVLNAAPGTYWVRPTGRLGVPRPPRRYLDALITALDGAGYPISGTGEDAEWQQIRQWLRGQHGLRVTNDRMATCRGFQRYLTDQGLYAGAIDGFLGPQSIWAITAWLRRIRPAYI